MFGIFGVDRVIGMELVVNSANAIGCVVINIGAKHLIEGSKSMHYFVIFDVFAYWFFDISQDVSITCEKCFHLGPFGLQN